MKSAALMFWLVLLVLLGVGYGSWQWLRTSQDDDWHSGNTPLQSVAYKTGLTQTPGGTLADFTLVDSADKEFHLHDTKGQVRAVSFFFVTCPSICFQLNNTLARLQTELPAGNDMQFISITCDPTHDTPAQLATYAPRFGADPKHWVFLTGDMPTIQRIGLAMLISVGPASHTDRVTLLDRQGRIRGNFRATEPQQYAQLKEAIATLSAEPYDAATDATSAAAATTVTVPQPNREAAIIGAETGK